MKTMSAIVMMAALAGLAAAGCKDRKVQSGAGDVPEKTAGAVLELRSSAFADGEAIPSAYTCEGADQSPPLEWSAPPEGTRSLVLVMDDPDAPKGTWVHWVLYAIPPATTSLGENLPKEETVSGGMRQGTTDFDKVGYGGPCPPPGSAHHYSFRIYALDIPSDFEMKLTRAQLEEAIEGHVLAEGKLTGTFKR